jgi:hypothetical protein
MDAVRASRRRGGDLGADDADPEYWAKNPIKDFPNYAAGTWGPSAGDALMEMDGRKWRNCNLQ